MPQLDKFSFVSQIFWLIIIFFALYFVLINLILPQLFSILKVRSKLLSVLKKDLLWSGDKEILVQKRYITHINYFVVQTTYSLAHLRNILDNHLNYVQNYIKNVVFFE